MENLITVEQKVRAVLEQDADARNDDMTLYVRTCDSYVKGISQQSLETVMLQYRLFGLPPFESVRRTRQKLQAAFPELAGNPRTQRLRTEQEQAYREYAGVPTERRNQEVSDE